jgi:glutaredoxin
MEIIIYTKHDCERCQALKAFLKKKSLDYTERDIDTEEVVQELVASEYILNNFCDEEQCIVITPIVKLDGKWMDKELFTEEGKFQEGDAKKIFKTN